MVSQEDECISLPDNHDYHHLFEDHGHIITQDNDFEENDSPGLTDIQSHKAATNKPIHISSKKMLQKDLFGNVVPSSAKKIQVSKPLVYLFHSFNRGLSSFGIWRHQRVVTNNTLVEKLAIWVNVNTKYKVMTFI